VKIIFANVRVCVRGNRTGKKMQVKKALHNIHVVILPQNSSKGKVFSASTTDAKV